MEENLVPPPVEEKKKTNVWLIVGIVAIVLCCCLVVAGFGAKWLYDNGDEIFGLAQQASFILA